MNCPYCNCDMVLGYLQSSRMLVWDREKLSGIIIPSAESGMQLTKTFSKRHAIKTYFCEKCKILLSVLDENVGVV